MPKKRILFVSDSLGTPIHARGIFNFTCGIVQVFNDLGFETALLIEQPQAGTACLTSRDGALGDISASAHKALISDLIRHFEGERFRFDWNYLDPSLQRFAQQPRIAANFRALIEDSERQRKQIDIRLQPGELEDFEFSIYSEHLKLFSCFVLSRSFYSESLRRANLDLRPVVVDAAGFDYVYIDTPHFVDVTNIDKLRIYFVAHDFIPLFDKHLGFDWRQLFVQKMDMTNRIAANVIFNSRATEKSFHEIYGNSARGRSIVVYPPNRSEVEMASDGADRTQPSNYLAAIKDDKLREQPDWKTDLPFFFSILSDEPRKNIIDVVEVSKRFHGRANFVVAGQIDGSRYMQGNAKDFPNLHFTGYISDVQKFDLLRACRAFVFPSIHEGFGIPIVEAAMFGAPVICTDTEVFREVTFNEAAYYKPHDLDTLASHLGMALRKLPSNDYRDVTREKVRKVFGQEAMAKQVRSFFAEAA